MQKKIFKLILLFLVMVSSVHAQEWSVKNFSVASNDISASQYERKDSKGVACALVKILMVGSIKDVKGNVVGEIADKGSEKWVYVQKGSKSLQVTVADGKTLSVDFKSYGIPEVMSKATYLLEILEPTAMRLTKDVETVTVNGVTFKLIRVDGGTFTMGSKKIPSNQKQFYYELRHDREHQVTLSTFYICETEITNELWRSINKRSAKYANPKFPQNQVSWFECCSFAEELSQITGLNFRLPTEAEWEFAARGGNKSKGYKYSGSNNLKEAGWWSKDDVDLHAVGYKANELGIYDMTGNVAEWCLDTFSRYDYECKPQTDPIGEDDEHPERKCVRGGDYMGSNKDCEMFTVSRNYMTDVKYDRTVGFRLVVPVDNN